VDAPAGIAPYPRLDIAAPTSTGVDAAPGRVLQEWRDNDGRLVASGGSAPGPGWWMYWPGLATYWFGAAGPVTVVPIAAGFDDQLRDIFVRGVMPVVLLARGHEALHASAVLTPTGVIVLCGTSGTGKSTLAAALASLGLNHFADDSVVYRIANGEACATALPFPVRVDPAALRSFANRNGGAAVQHAGRSGPAAIQRVYHLVRDMTVPAERPRFTPESPVKRFELLLSHAHPFEMGGADRHRQFLERLLILARSVPVWECRFAPALESLPTFARAVAAHAAEQ
jgi:hypothetical protein